MKKILFTLAIAAISATASNAQSVFGIKKERPVIVTEGTEVVTVPGGPVIIDRRNDDRRDDDRVVRNRRNLPPGQAKKLYGHKSAKAFAPGQQKKRYRNDNSNQELFYNDGNGNKKFKNKGKGKGKNKH